MTTSQPTKEDWETAQKLAQIEFYNARAKAIATALVAERERCTKIAEEVVVAQTGKETS